MQGGKKIKKQLLDELDLLKDRNNTPVAGETNCERAIEVLREPETILREIFESSPDRFPFLIKTCISSIVTGMADTNMFRKRSGAGILFVTMRIIPVKTRLVRHATFLRFSIQANR